MSLSMGVESANSELDKSAAQDKVPDVVPSEWTFNRIADELVESTDDDQVRVSLLPAAMVCPNAGTSYLLDGPALD